MQSTSPLYILKLVLCSWGYFLALNTKRVYVDTHSRLCLWKRLRINDKGETTTLYRKVGIQIPSNDILVQAERIPHYHRQGNLKIRKLWKSLNRYHDCY